MAQYSVNTIQLKFFNSPLNMQDDSAKKQDALERDIHPIKQNSAISMIFKQNRGPLRPEEQGQQELKQAFQQLERQLKNASPKQVPIEQEDKPTKVDDIKKKRVDKNKCRVCGESTIPVILGLINEECVNMEPNTEMTMRKIRENLMQRKNENANQTDVLDLNIKTKPAQNVPYIPLNYLQKIVICKRCRFKFHSDCLTEQGLDCTKLQENWICSYCDDKIKELQSLNQWDYENNKKKKKDQPVTATSATKQKPDNHSVIKQRINEQKQIFKIEGSIRKPEPAKSVQKEPIAKEDFVTPVKEQKMIIEKEIQVVQKVIAQEFSEKKEVKEQPQEIQQIYQPRVGRPPKALKLAREAMRLAKEEQEAKQIQEEKEAREAKQNQDIAEEKEIQVEKDKIEQQVPKEGKRTVKGRPRKIKVDVDNQLEQVIPQKRLKQEPQPTEKVEKKDRSSRIEKQEPERREKTTRKAKEKQQ